MCFFVCFSWNQTSLRGVEESLLRGQEINNGLSHDVLQCRGHGDLGGAIDAEFAGGIHDNSSRDGGISGVADTGAGVLQWQERQHTRKKIEKLLLRSKHNTEGIVVTDTNDSIGAGEGIVFVCVVRMIFSLSSTSSAVLSRYQETG